MAFTTVGKVTGMFPSFTTGPTQKPSTDDIQTYVDDVDGELRAILVRRFSESMAEPPASGSLEAWLNNLDPLANAVLEKINRYGAAAQLGLVLATLGSKSTAVLAEKFQADFERMRNALDSRDEDGAPLFSGAYDRFFDSKARVESPRPGISVSTGSDRQQGETAADRGLNMPFSMDEVI
jgi:hypothetical protein